MEVSEARVVNILTRSSGYLRGVCSHSLQPYRGCAYGNSLCGVGCYVRHNRFATRGAAWGSFLEARVNAAQSYRDHYARERVWGRRQRGSFAIFLSSATDPFVPQERRWRVTRGVLEVMCELPPDELIVQTHSHTVADSAETLLAVHQRCALRVHISIESDGDRLPGLPPPASSVERRLAAAAALKKAGLRVVVTVSPLLPIADPGSFFRRVAGAADAVVLDHFIGGDGSRDGTRTRRTALPDAMALLDAESLHLDYRERMREIAEAIMPGRVGISADGFAGRFR